MSNKKNVRKDAEDMWTRTFQACAEQDALERESANDLRRSIFAAFKSSGIDKQLVAFGMLSTAELKMASVNDFYIALGRCKDIETLREVLEWFDMTK